ncbi:hypothetical protein Leryth_021138 [Lithospermum erythrorhizon]|nr:hypothetical protein Leryth_021138 [Lithospermum erythrorhizon]
MHLMPSIVITSRMGLRILRAALVDMELERIKILSNKTMANNVTAAATQPSSSSHLQLACNWVPVLLAATFLPFL